MVEKISEYESEHDKSTYRYSLKTGFSNIHVYSPENTAPNPLDLLDSSHQFQRRIPGGLQIEDRSEDSPENPTINLTLKDEEQASVDMSDSQNFTLSGPFENKDFAMRLPYIAYNITERVRQEDLAMTSLHAASVATTDGRSILILGDKGSGKTLMSLTFGLQYNFGLIGSDLILADNKKGQLFFRAGNQLFDVRQAVIKYYLPELTKPTQHTSSNPYEEKITLLPEEVGISIGQDKNGLATVVRVNVHPFNDKTVIEKGARRIQEILRLRENASRYIRGIVTPLFMDDKNIEGNFPSLDTDNLVRQRDQMLEQLLDSNFLYAYGNDPREIASEIANTVL